MVTEFNINATDKIVGRTSSTRNGFKHVVEYYRNGNLLETRSVSYLNRTWESFEYETAISLLLEKMRLPDVDRANILKICSDISLGKTNSMFKSVSAIASMGDLFGKTTKEKNDWKARMIKAGLGGMGLEMPEDWDTLSESEKEKRLNRIIEMLREKR